MRRGFFAGSELTTKAPVGLLPKCGACGLHAKCNTPKMSIAGKGKRKILIIGSMPSYREEETGTPNAGEENAVLKKILLSCGVSLENDCWKTNALICRSQSPPTSKQVDFCQPNITNAIKELNPIVIICMGSDAIRSVVGPIWKEAPGSETKWHGWTIPSQQLNAWVCPTLNLEQSVRQDEPTLHRIFKNEIEEAVGYKKRPWKTIESEADQVECIKGVNKAAKRIDAMRKSGGAIAFDYETNMLKPDDKRSSIISCSICWKGQETIAYPWHGAAIEATKRILESPCPKIASNLKFEERWTRRHLGIRVNEWFWDTMLAAHVIDNRDGITSIKFQAFVLLGSSIWNDHIDKYLKAKGSEINQIQDEVSLDDLLLYNGLDSLLEYRVAKKQMKVLGHPKLKELK